MDWHLLTLFKFSHMETLDSAVPKGNPNASYWPYVTRFGLISGAIGAAFTLVLYLSGNSLSPMVWSIVAGVIGLVSAVISTIVATRGVRAYRETDLGGLIPFGKAFVVAFLIMVLGSLISSAVNMLYITVIDPDFSNNIASRMSDWMLEVGMDEASVEKQVEQMKKNFGIGKQLTNTLIFTPVGGAILGLIAAAVAKRNPPME
jgi:hypothetical protein